MSRCGLEGKQPTALWDNRSLQQEEDMTETLITSRAQ